MQRLLPLVALAALGGSACRDYHDTIERPLEDCQPYVLECSLCTYDDDAADDRDLQRIYRCEMDGESYDAVQRRSPDGDADDTHYYEPESGYRLAAGRWHDQPVMLCGHEIDIEWWGLVLDACEPVCEHERLADSDETLPDC
jgi:hypothetical protein